MWSSTGIACESVLCSRLNLDGGGPGTPPIRPLRGAAVAADVEDGIEDIHARIRC